MAKKQALFTTRRQFARAAANLDGKYNGVTQAEAEKMLTFVFDYGVAARLAGFKCPVEMLHKRVVAKEKSLKKKLAAIKQKASKKKTTKKK